MNFLLTLAQLGSNDPEVDTPLKKFIWFGLVPMAILAIIFGGGMLLKRAEMKARAEREALRKQQNGSV